MRRIIHVIRYISKQWILKCIFVLNFKALIIVALNFLEECYLYYDFAIIKLSCRSVKREKIFEQMYK
jgi:hypothetical protein